MNQGLTCGDLTVANRGTLQYIKDNSAYNAACARPASERTREDIMILQKRTAHLQLLAELPPQVHYELCRAMKYRKVAKGVVLVRRRHRANRMMLIMSGTAHAFSSDPPDDFDATTFLASPTKADVLPLQGRPSTLRSKSLFKQVRPSRTRPVHHKRQPSHRKPHSATRKSLSARRDPPPAQPTGWPGGPPPP